MYKYLLVLTFIACASAQITKLQWSLCGPGVIDIYNFDATPMPIRQPANMTMVLDAKNREIIRGQVKADVNIVRIVSGLRLKVDCFIVNGNSYGSCIYNDLCGVLKSALSLDENNCPQNLIDNNIPCKCPFDLPIRDLNINQDFEIPNLANTPVSFFNSGDFDVTIKGTIGLKNILCLNMKFSVKPR